MSDSVIADTPEVTEDVVLDSETEVNADLSSDTASDSGENHEENQPQEDVQQLKAAAAFQTRQAKRLQTELDELKNKQPEVIRPDVPPMPDEFDDDFQSKLQARDDAIRLQAEHDAGVKFAETQLQEAQLRQQTEDQAALAVKVQAYSSNATKLGITPQDLQTAGGIVGQYGLREDVATALLDDDEGALVTLYLASNPLAIENLNGANMLSIGQVYADIKSKASALKPKQSDAPPPVELLNGGGQLEQKHPALEGVIYS